MLRSQYASKVVAIRQGTPGTWNAEWKVNGMGSMDGKPITVCESVLLSRSLTLRGKASVAVWLKLVAPPQIFCIEESWTMKQLDTPSLHILVPIQVLL